MKVRNGKESGVLRFKLDEIKQVWTTGQLLSLCLNRIKEGEADDWELFVEEGAIVQKVGDEDDVVGKLLQRRYLILQRKP